MQCCLPHHIWQGKCAITECRNLEHVAHTGSTDSYTSYASYLYPSRPSATVLKFLIIYICIIKIYSNVTVRYEYTVPCARNVHGTRESRTWHLGPRRRRRPARACTLAQGPAAVPDWTSLWLGDATRAMTSPDITVHRHDR